MKRPGVLWVVLAMGFVGLFAFRAGSLNRWEHLTGSTMGTTYQIHFNRPWYSGTRAVEAEVDSLLEAINQELSTWDKNSWISRFNRAPAGEEMLVPPHAWAVLAASLDVAEISEGAFDPTCFPLLSLWGFGPEPDLRGEQPSEESIRQLLKTVGYRYLSLEMSGHTISKHLNAVQIDCSALTKGYAIDRIAGILESRGFGDYSVEIGGEIRTGGKDPSGNLWTVHLETPTGIRKDAPRFELRNQSIATSGGSRDYKKIGDTIYTHIIDPRTGYPVRQDVSCFSVSVIAPNCMLADALATAAFVLGPDHSDGLKEAFPDCVFYFFNQAQGGLNRLDQSL